MRARSGKTSRKGSRADALETFQKTSARKQKPSGEKLTIASIKFDCPTLNDYENFKAELSRIGFDMTRSLEQNDAFHPWVRACAKRWNEYAEERREGFEVKITEESMKEMFLLAFGNKRVVSMPGKEDYVIAMRTHKYAATDDDLGPQERKARYISMHDLMSEIQAWAATELNLELGRD